MWGEVEKRKQAEEGGDEEGAKRRGETAFPSALALSHVVGVRGGDSGLAYAGESSNNFDRSGRIRSEEVRKSMKTAEGLRGNTSSSASY